MRIGSSLAITRQGGVGPSAPPFTPTDLSPLLWHDASDLTTLWTDSGRTTQVTTDGDPVGAWDDKSGNANHSTQSTAAQRPMYKTSAGLHRVLFDGVDDNLLVSAASSAANYTFCIGVDYVNNAGSPNEYVFDSQTGRFVIALESGGDSTEVGYFDGGWKDPAAKATGQQVLTWQLVAGTGTASIRRDGSQIGPSLNYTQKAIGGTTRLGADYTAIGARITSSLYQVVLTSPATTGADLSDLESFVADKTGAP